MTAVVAAGPNLPEVVGQGKPDATSSRGDVEPRSLKAVQQRLLHGAVKSLEKVKDEVVGRRATHTNGSVVGSVLQRLGESVGSTNEARLNMPI